MQHEIKTKHPLLDENGHVIEAGWSREYLLEYNRDAIKVPEKDIREWEYFLALERDYGLGISMANVGSTSRLSVHLMDFAAGWDICESDLWIAEGSEGLHMPRNVWDSTYYKTETAEGIYEKKADTCHVRIDYKNLTPGNDFKADLVFTVPEGDKTVMVIPYKTDPNLFYYNYKVNCMPVEGMMEYKGKRYEFHKETAAGTNDWGRGIWEHVNQWYWGSCSTTLNGKPFGFNIGHGFGDTSQATENIVFYDRKANKLEDVIFRIPGDVIGDLKLTLPDENYMKPWKFESSDGRLDMDFIPVHDRQSGLSVGDYNSGQHQVFGLFSGKAVLDDGTELVFKDLFGFAEKVGNAW